MTEHFYIPREVWRQERLQIFDAEKKLEIITSLTREMRAKGIVKKNHAMTKNFKEVDALVHFVRKTQDQI